MRPCLRDRTPGCSALRRFQGPLTTAAHSLENYDTFCFSSSPASFPPNKVMPLTRICDLFLLSFNNCPWQPHILASLFLIWTSKLAHHLVAHFVSYTLSPFLFSTGCFTRCRTVNTPGPSVASGCQENRSPKPEPRLSRPRTSIGLGSQPAPPLTHTTLHASPTAHRSLHVPSGKTTAHNAWRPPSPNPQLSPSTRTHPPPVQVPALSSGLF